MQIMIKMKPTEPNDNGCPAAQKARTLNSVLSLFELGSAIVDGAYGNAETDEEAYREMQLLSGLFNLNGKYRTYSIQ